MKKSRAIATYTLLALLALPGPVNAAESTVEPEVLNMPMREWGRLGLFIRAEYIERYVAAFGFDSHQHNSFHACLIAAAAHPTTRDLSFRQASRQCVIYARTKD